MFEDVYTLALVVSALALVILTFVDIARRRPGRRMTEAWGNPSAMRIAAMIACFGLLLVGALFF